MERYSMPETRAWALLEASAAARAAAALRSAFSRLAASFAAFFASLRARFSSSVMLARLLAGTPSPVGCGSIVATGVIHNEYERNDLVDTRARIGGVALPVLVTMRKGGLCRSFESCR
ncbi:unnamed protein product [Chondrus crispus]|uniref:Uncharacterized protein n=1 Tax=Chondrus crispus TaxID=2769 RepID=R7QN99_CHOCR|nr:unnamed protein product [Chondrus crispus]CDF38946.1 unnamed protein product [Chondrus crispus]|eukprot:XP_005718852.1 unnamed protein product [Chondrus crispus]